MLRWLAAVLRVAQIDREFSSWRSQRAWDEYIARRPICSLTPFGRRERWDAIRRLGSDYFSELSGT